MALKEQFIEHFGDFKKFKKCFKTAEKHGLYLYYNYSKKEEHLSIDEKEFSTLLIIENGKSHLLKSFDNETMLERFDYYVPDEILKKVQIICREIEIRNLEKQMLEDTKHTAPAKTRLIKF